MFEFLTLVSLVQILLHFRTLTRFKNSREKIVCAWVFLITNYFSVHHFNIKRIQHASVFYNVLQGQKCDITFSRPDTSALSP